ncbi:TonB-dependent receptor [Emcibacter nanhaiensis]|uniref:TonB-dependent receptor n=1 Tax=Emcibacter nanhaiensis TaxID=1505037 RepID=A0A501PF91_9PROT|nr:TonB-dependent receptor [Emcibacter nanhaiensis]TPD59119.1 TonB-dependent receptor [Emcibacter nanhaiensis]
MLFNKSDTARHAFKAALAASTAFAALATSGAYAQEEEKKSSSIFMEEVVITAQKREQSAQDVGIAITALSGSQLKALGYTNAQEVTALAPGVATLQPNGEANYAIGIRGVANNDFTTNVESPVAVYVDEVYISQMSGAGFLLFDVDRVELLRGPQGTLFGRNATGGLVHYITVKPNLDEFNGYGSVSYGSFERMKFQGAVGIPVNDKFALRASFATHQGDGYVTNRLKPDSKLNNANESAGRLQALFQPTDELEILLNARFGQQDIRTGFFEYESAVLPTGDATPGVPNVDLDGYVDLDGDNFAGDYNRQGHNILDTEGYTATIKWDQDWGTLTSITDYQTVKRDYIEDSDASPFDYFNFFLTTDSEQFSQELRLNGETDNLKWVTGFYYMDLKVRDSNGGIMPGLFQALIDVGAFEPDIPAGLPLADVGFNGIYNPYETDTETWSLFAQLEYQLSDELALIGGFRWIEEDKSHHYDNLLMWYPDTSDSGQDPNAAVIAPALPNVPYDGSRSDSNWSARAQINYTPTEDLLVYASWNRGVKSGGYNAPLLPSSFAVTEPFMTYDPEKLDAYEVGFKWDTMDGRLRINAAAYYYDYNNYQAFSIIGLDTSTLNAQAENKGFEVEIQANPVDGLDLNFGIAYTDVTVSEVTGLTTNVDTDGDGVDDVDSLFPVGTEVKPVQTPKWNLNGLIRYEFDAGEGRVALQADGQYRAKHYFALTNLPASTQDGYFIGNASVTYYSPDENWSVRAFVKNFTDENYLVQTFDLSGNVTNGGLFGLIEKYYGMPRTWGVNLTYNF